jgi:low affinity Fe/Cu permease
MSNSFPLMIESMVAVLLLLTILYCVRLNNSIKRLKGDETELKATIAELLTAAQTAERAIAGLKMTTHEAGQTLSERLRDAERFSTEISRQIEAGGGILNRLAQIAAVPTAPAGMRNSKPAVPDPKTIMAAAQAFADRARSRVKGLAA